MMRTATSIAILMLGFSIVGLPGAAQDETSALFQKGWSVGASFSSVLMTNGDHGGTGRSVQVAWQSGERWGIQAAFQYDEAINRDFGDGFGPADGQWEDERRTSGTVTVFWQAVQFETGDLTHSIRVRGGPSVQRERGEEFRAAASVSEGRLEEEVRFHRGEEYFDNMYLLNYEGEGGKVLFLTESVDRTAFGMAAGLSYGITYSPLTVRLDFSTRGYAKDIGGTHGIGLALELRI